MTRNLAELGLNLQRIVSRLQANQTLLKLLYYTDKDPLSQEDLTETQIKDEVFEKLIKVVPQIGAKDTAKSVLAIRVVNGSQHDENDQFLNLTILVELFVPLNQWIIKDTNLRPFCIMGEIKDSLSDKTVKGLGKMVGGDFELSLLTEEISCYEMTYQITSYA